MRFASTFVFSALAACILPSVTAIHYPRSGSLVKRGVDKVPPSGVIAQRQYRVKRDLIDICISAEAGVLLSPLLAILNPTTAHANLCLCVHDLDIFLKSDLGVELGGLLGGKNILETALKLLLNTSPEAHHCTFPPHSRHICKPHDPCAYECDKPYVPGPGKTCICPPGLIECNGTCGAFPHGCGSTVPHHPKQRSDVGEIDTFAEARVFCQSKTVCGVPGREEETTFECIDTRSTLDSCGGCVTPHRFTDATPSPIEGTDCSHLPGVITASCTNSRCVITQCREGWHLDIQGGMCIDPSTGLVRRASNSSRMKKERIPEVLITTDVVLDYELVAKLQTYVGLVIGLVTASDAIPSASTPPHTLGSQSTINHTYLVGAVVTTTGNLLNSHTVVEVVANIDIAVNVNEILAKAFKGCGCTGVLGLGPLVQQLVKVVDAALDIQKWCGNHPIAMPAPHPSNSPTGTTPKPPVIPNTSNTVITIGLNTTLDTLLSAAVESHAFVGVGGFDLTSTVDIIVTGLGLGIGSARDSSKVDGVVVINSQLLERLDVLVDLFAAIDLSRANSPALIGTSPILPSITTSLTSQPTIADIVVIVSRSTFNLLSSRTTTSFVANANALANVNTHVTTVLATCNCVHGQNELVKTLAAIANLGLDIQDWCGHNPVGAPVPHPSGTSSPPHNGSGDMVIVGLDELTIRYLGTDVAVKSFTGAGLTHSLNNPLDVSGIASAGVISPRVAPLVVDTDVILGVDSTLVAQLRIVGDHVLDVKSASSCLPAAPPNSPPVPGTNPNPSTPPPVDTNLVDGLVRLTYDLLNSKTDIVLVYNLQVLVNAGLIVNSTLSGCSSCASDLGMAELLKKVDALLVLLLDLQSWCGHHPVVSPTNPPGHSSSFPPHPGPSSTAPVPTPTHPSSPGPPPPSGNVHIPIDLGLGDLLVSLGVNLSGNVAGLLDLNNLAGTLVNVVVSIRGHSSPLPPSSPPSVSHTPRPSPSPHPDPHAPLTQGLIDALLIATVNLLQSPSGTDLVLNIKTLLNVTGLLAEGLDTCGCVSHLGLEPLVEDVDRLLDVVLAISLWCQYHPGVGGTTIPGGGNGGDHGSPSSIIIDAKRLLSALGLGNVLQLHGTVGGLGDAVNGLVNPILHGIGLGGLRRWLAAR